jgi:pimeloyl-[acyl-carrier protein] methyl ester esterase
MIKRLVLLPGMHGTGELFSEFMRMIPGQDRIEALHYPTGVSPSCSQLQEAVAVTVPESDPYVLLAESFSTPLAIQFAATNPTNLRGLILCAGFATSPIHGWLKLVASLIAPLAFHLPLPKIAVAHFLVGPDAPESLHSAVRATIRSVKSAVLSARLRQILAVDARLELNKVSVPILFIQAQQDRLVGPSCLEEIVGIKPQIKVAKIRGPHLILQREPQQSADIVTRFINSLP